MHKVNNHLLASGKKLPVTRLCAMLGLPRSTAYYEPKTRPDHRPVDEVAAAKIEAIIEAEPACGVRGVWSRLRFRDGLQVNRKKVHRIMRIKGWTVRQRRKGSRPRAKAMKSVAATPDERWATDIALVDCGKDGWCAFVPVVDCCTRECLGWALERTARAKTAERALEEALIGRFGWLRCAPGMALRHDNGLVFGSRRYRALCADYGIRQEYTAPYTPEQNGLCERFIRTFKEELCWIRRFTDLEHARSEVRAFIYRYNTERPHQALDYRTPKQEHHRKCEQMAA